MADDTTSGKRQAHDLIERLAPRQVSAVVDLLEAMLDPVARAVANAPVDDEPESEAERATVAQSKAWFEKRNGEGIPQDQLLSELGAKPADLRNQKDRT